MKNKTAGHVVETVYNDIASGPQRVSMLQEFLDNEFMHFKVKQRPYPDPYSFFLDPDPYPIYRLHLSI